MEFLIEDSLNDGMSNYSLPNKDGMIKKNDVEISAATRQGFFSRSKQAM